MKKSSSEPDQINLFFFFRNPRCVFSSIETSLPHSGQSSAVEDCVSNKYKLYLHFLQCLSVEIRLPTRPRLIRVKPSNKSNMIVMVSGVII